MSWQHFKQTWLIKFWAPAPAVIAAGILSTYSICCYLPR